MNDPMQPSPRGKAETQTLGSASSLQSRGTEGGVDWGAGGKTPVKGGWDQGPGQCSAMKGRGS